MSFHTILHGLDDFMWPEEMNELDISHDLFQALKATSVHRSIDSGFILESLAGDPERWNAYSLLSSLNESVFSWLRSIEYSAQSFESIRGLFSELRTLGLFRIFATHLSRLAEFESQNRLVRDISIQSRSSSDSSGSGSPMLGLESSIVAGEFRLCLNILWMSILVDQDMKWDDEMNPLLHVLISVLRKPSHVVPVRKALLLTFELLRIACSIPPSKLIPGPNSSALLGQDEETPSPQTLLMNTFPLSLPTLSDFRSLVALSVHQKSLIDSPVQSVALEEGITIIDKYVAEFFASYDFHELEIDFMRNTPDMLRTFRAYMRVEKKNKRLGLRKTEKVVSNISEFAKHLVGNYQVVRARSATGQPSTDPVSSASESEDDSTILPLVNEIFSSCKSWIKSMDDDDALIEAIANAAVPAIVPPTLLSTPEDSPHSDSPPVLPSREILGDFIINLLKILLSSCRGSGQGNLTSPTNLVTFDIDRDHLLAVLERFEMAPPLVDNSEWKRKNFEIISSTICGIFQIFFSNVFDIQPIMESVFVANNGCLVLLKLITSAPEDGLEIISAFSQSVISPSIFSFSTKPNCESFFLSRPSTLATSLFRAMKTLYSLTRHNPARIKKFLVHYKLAVILKRFFRCPNLSLQKIAYKLFKKQIRYLGKKWKFLHTKLISNCYAMTATEVMDDWLISDPPDSNGGVVIGHDNNFSEDVLNDSVIGPPSDPLMPTENDDYAAYIAALQNMNFDNPHEIERFQHKFPSNDQFFFGHKNFREYLKSLGL